MHLLKYLLGFIIFAQQTWYEIYDHKFKVTLLITIYSNDANLFFNTLVARNMITKSFMGETLRNFIFRIIGTFYARKLILTLVLILILKPSGHAHTIGNPQVHA